MFPWGCIVDFVLTDERCKQITSAARALWCEFLDMNPQFESASLLRSRGGSTPKKDDTSRRRFLPPPPLPRNECAEAFFSHCADPMAPGVATLVLNEMNLGEWIPGISVLRI